MLLTFTYNKAPFNSEFHLSIHPFSSTSFELAMSFASSDSFSTVKRVIFDKRKSKYAEILTMQSFLPVFPNSVSVKCVLLSYMHCSRVAESIYEAGKTSRGLQLSTNKKIVNSVFVSGN